MKYSEFKRWLQRQGVVFITGNRGSHQKIRLGDRYSVFPNHGSKEIPPGIVSKIKKDLGLK